MILLSKKNDKFELELPPRQIETTCKSKIIMTQEDQEMDVSN